MVVPVINYHEDWYSFLKDLCELHEAGKLLTYAEIEGGNVVTQQYTDAGTKQEHYEQDTEGLNTEDMEGINTTTIESEGTVTEITTAWYLAREDDTVESLAKDFNTTAEIIRAVNDMDEDIDVPVRGVLMRVPAPEMINNPNDTPEPFEGFAAAGDLEYENGVRIRPDGEIKGLSERQEDRINRLDFEARWSNAIAENPYVGSTFDKMIVMALHEIREGVIDGTIPDSPSE